MAKISMRLNKNKVENYCINFEPRPMLRVKHARLGWETFHYVGAIENFAHVLKKKRSTVILSKGLINQGTGQTDLHHSEEG